MLVDLLVEELLVDSTHTCICTSMVGGIIGGIHSWYSCLFYPVCPLFVTVVSGPNRQGFW